MRKRKKCFISLLLCASIAFALCGCGASQLSFFVNDKDIKEFDTSLFYGNVETMRGADPSLIWVESREGDPDSGYYYAYVTASSTINAWRTNDMTNWQYLGAVFRPNLDEHWASTNFWAPAVIYDEDEGTYYMYYSASWNKYSYATHFVSLAKSDSPMGPFEEVGGSDAPLVNFANIPEDNPLYEYHPKESTYDSGYFSAIDAEPFVDPADGSKYLLFTHDKGAGYSASSTYIMKMKDWETPDYSSVTCISQAGYVTVGGSETIDEGTVNEGPYMSYHDGYYYLTFSVHTYTESSYQVRQAVGTSPMGPFRKISTDKGGTVITTDGLGIYTNSSGHHSLILVGDELFISYHTFLNDSDIAESRKIRFDRVGYVINEDGIPVLYASGPTVTLQPLPGQMSGYENKAPDAQITATNLTDGSDLYWLNDGTLKIHDDSVVDETYFKEGKSRITLVWEDYVPAKAILVYNSCNYDSSFTGIDNIKIWYRKDNRTGVYKTGKLNFNYDIYGNEDYNAIYAGTPIAIEFDDLNIEKVEITLSESLGGEKMGISEITVLGKEESK